MLHKRSNRSLTNTGYDHHFIWWSRNGRRLPAALDRGVLFSDDAGAIWRQSYTIPIVRLYHVDTDDGVPDYRVCSGLQDNNSWCAISSSRNGIAVLNRGWELIAPGDGMWSIFDPNDGNWSWSTEVNASACDRPCAVVSGVHEVVQQVESRAKPLRAKSE